MQEELRIVLIGEDRLCQAVMHRLLQHSGRNFCVVLARIEGGIGKIQQSIPKYCNACRATPHVILADLDQEPCPSALLAKWKLTHMPTSLLIRFAIREVEAWLLADAEGLAQFMSIPRAKVPQDPESLANPKQDLVNLARRSRSKRFKDELVPSTGSRVPIGPLYNERLSQFVQSSWSVERAALAQRRACNVP